MTEAEWPACRTPSPMFSALRGRITARKLRLYACAVARRIWPLLTDPRTCAAVAVAERYADGDATLDDLRAGCESAAAAAEDAERRIAFPLEADPWWYGMLRGYHTGGPAVGILASDAELGVWPGDWWSCCSYFLEQVESGVGFVAGHAVSPLATDVGPGDGLRLLALRREAAGAEVAGLADVVRCLFPNPFRPVAFPPSWPTSTAVALARQMYDARDFSAMPILADALQEAGCDNADILSHCRESGPHVRGCWVVDLVLGKE